MTPKIYADPPKFHQVAEDLRRIAKELRQGGSHLLSATADARSYDGQYAPWVQPIALDGDHRTRGLSERIDSLAHTLDLIAQGFEEADNLDQKGFSSLADQIRAIIESGFFVSSFPRWLIGGQCPPWINSEAWNRLPLDDRDAFLASLGEDWLRFVESGDYSHGTDQDTWNAFMVYLITERVIGGPFELETWKSAARAAGMSLEDYVMKMMDISEFDRDMVGGIGLVETRDVGPAAMLLCSQNYLHRLLDEENWGDHGLAWEGFAAITSGYEIDYDAGPEQGRNYAQYLEDSIAGGTNQANKPTITHWENWFYENQPENWKLEYEGSPNTHAEAALASQDAAWRLIAGYRLAEIAGDEYVTFFLNDENSIYWKYNEALMEAGLLIPDPGSETLDQVMAKVEKAYQFNNVYETNPSIDSFLAIKEAYPRDPETGQILYDSPREEIRRITYFEWSWLSKDNIPWNVRKEVTDSFVYTYNLYSGRGFESHAGVWSEISRPGTNIDELIIKYLKEHGH
jgi:hypothetical protein